MTDVKGFNTNIRTGPYAVAASQARYMIERSDWRGAAGLPVQASRFPYVDAVTHFARALGSARSGDPNAARAEIAKLAELREKLREAKDAYWAEQVDIQWQGATAWLLHAEGKHEGALTAMQAAADAEDRTEKSIVTPGPLAPARELYGAMLLARGLRERRSPRSRRRCARSRTASTRWPAPRGPPSFWATRRTPGPITRS